MIPIKILSVAYLLLSQSPTPLPGSAHDPLAIRIVTTMYRASFIRTALRLFLAAFIVSQAQSAFAQTVSDPGIVEFDPSPDHSRVTADGTPYMTEYRMSLYVTGQSSPFAQVSLGKPAAQSDGKIRVNFLPLISPLTAGVIYEARVAASGPGGTGTSLASNQFRPQPPARPPFLRTRCPLDRPPAPAASA